MHDIPRIDLTHEGKEINIRNFEAAGCRYPYKRRL